MGRARPTGETREAPAGTRWPQTCHTPATSPTASHWSVRRAEGSAGAGPGDGQLLEAVAVMPPALCSVSQKSARQPLPGSPQGTRRGSPSSGERGFIFPLVLSVFQKCIVSFSKKYFFKNPVLITFFRGSF